MHRFGAFLPVFGIILWSLGLGSVNAGVQRHSFAGGLSTSVSTIIQNGVTQLQFGDVSVLKNDTYWKCDGIICPKETERCHVTKYKSPTDRTLLIRANICYSAQMVVLANQTTTKRIDSNADIKLNLDIYRSGGIVVHDSTNVQTFDLNGGSTLSESGEAELQETLTNIRSEIENSQLVLQQNLAERLSEVQKNIDQINADVRNTLQNIFGYN